VHAELAQAQQRALRELVFAERGYEQRLAGQARELHGRDRSSARGLFEGVARVHHFAGARDMVDARELHPLNVPYRRYPQSLHR
jgi:hypothetical protein